MTRTRVSSIRDRRSGAWLVLTRDVSESVHVEGEPQIRAGMVLDMDTGLVRGVAVGATEAEAVTQAFKIGLTKPAGSLPPGRPDEVLCGTDFEAQMVEVLSSLAGGDPRPPVRTIEPPAEAQDIFDSFIGHMSGRPQPSEPPAPSDWALLYRCALDFYRAAPWTRWHDGVVLVLRSDIESHDAARAAVVMGNSGIQHGLVLYPGGDLPDGLDPSRPDRAMSMPRGTVALMLDPPSHLPPDLRAKASRYGWPPDAEWTPVALRLGPEDAGDPGETDVQLLAVALAAVTRHDARGPVAAGPDDEATSGEVALGNGRTASFSIVQKPRAPDPSRLHVHQVASDLVPEGTPVLLGHLPWASVATLRGAARIHRPLPSDAPRPSGTEVPLLAILPGPEEGGAMAAEVAELDPYGVTAVATDGGQEVFVLAGTNGAHALMEVAADNPSVADFRRRLQATKGVHVVMVADEATSRGDGTVYGFFECHQPPPPKAHANTRSANSSRRRK